MKLGLDYRYRIRGVSQLYQDKKIIGQNQRTSNFPVVKPGTSHLTNIG